MNEQPKFKWHWRLLRWGLTGLAVLATLVAVLIAEEDWRGKHDWEAYKRAAEMRGERLDWSALAPAVASQETNASEVFPTNLVAFEMKETDEGSSIVKMNGTNINDFLKMKIPSGPQSDREFRTTRNAGAGPKEESGNWATGKMTDLRSWQSYYRSAPTNSAGEFPVAPIAKSAAADVLLALSKYDASIRELHNATSQSLFHFGTRKPDEQFMAESLKYFAESKGRARVLQLRAIAELASGQSTNALEDIELLLRLDRLVCEVPLLIAHLVGIAETAITIQPIYEGLAQHAWNDLQLAALEQDLTSMDFLSNYHYAMRGERDFAVGCLENQRITREMQNPEIVSGKLTGKTKNISLRWVPSAYFYQNELAFARLNEKFLQPLVDATNRLFSPVAVRQAQASLDQQMNHYSPYNIQALMTFPALSKCVEKFALIQADVDLARVACALERYRLAHGSYPATLDLLAPQFIVKIPHDVINGQPLHYRRSEVPSAQRADAANGKFVLYSVGWNETDDGGVVVLKTDSTSAVDSETGDWVWKY